MIDSQSERQKKAMKIHEIVSSDKNEFAECKQDLMKKIAMDGVEAEEVAHSMREMFLPKLLNSVGLNAKDMPFDFNVKMTDNDEGFAADVHDDNAINYGNELNNDDSEVDDELATIHITVPADKIRDVEIALENALGDSDAISKDHATDHEDQEDTGEEDMKNEKEIEANAALRKVILAAASDEDEVKSVSRVDKFDHDKSEQYKEEDFYKTTKGDMNDPEHTTLDFAENKVPNYSKLIDDYLSPDLGLHDTLTATSFEGSPSDDDGSDYSLDFDEFEVPSQGDKELFNEFEFPSENKQPHKHTIVASNRLGAYDADTAEEVLAFALKTAGVEDEDLGKITYAQGLELFKVIKTAEAEREHYSKDGKLPANFNEPKDPDRKAVTEDTLREHVGSEEDPEKDHERKGRELYSSDQYAELLKKLMKTSEKDTYNDYPDHGFTKGSESGKEDRESDTTVENGGDVEIKAETDKVKSAELYKARVKTAYAMTSKLITAGLLPANELDAYAEGMLEDGLTVTAMLRQTKLSLNLAASNAERFAASGASKAVRTSAGTSFNPSARGDVDISGATDLQQALKNVGWTAPKVETGMEE